MKPSEKFERQIKRIHELIEQPDAITTWNDHFPDPDNPTQARQIDITIKRANQLTLIECRIYSKKQNVKWIEELIGRRLSLKADAIIAVSASGFTKGAISKAKVYGIILRDLLSLTEEEISSWGHNTKAYLTFYRCENISITFFFDKKYQGQIPINDLYDALLKHPQNTHYNLVAYFHDYIFKNNFYFAGSFHDSERRVQVKQMSWRGQKDMNCQLNQIL